MLGAILVITEHETNVRLLLIHACRLGGADQQCIFHSDIYLIYGFNIVCCSIYSIKLIQLNKVWFYARNTNYL